MALELANAPTPAPAAESANLFAGIGDDAPAAVAPEPTAPVDVAPEPVAPAAPAEPVAPLEEIAAAEEAPAFKLPTDEVVAEPEPETPVAPGDKQGFRIEELKTELKTVWKPKVAELESVKTQLEAQILELKGKAQQAEELEARLAENEQEMSIVRLERTKTYIEQVDTPLKAIEAKAQSIAETYGIDEKKMFDAFIATDEAERRALIKEATSGLDIDPDDALELRSLIREAQPIFAKQNELRAKPAEALAELSARAEQETATQAAARAAERVKLVDTVSRQVTKALPFMEAILTEVAAKAKDVDPSTLDAPNQVYNALAGPALAKLANLHTKLQADYDRALDEIEAMKKASPAGNGGFAPTGVRAPSTSGGLFDGL